MIIIISIILILCIIIWLQYPDLKDDLTEPTYKRIFTRIKIPIIFICAILIFLLNKNIIPENKLINQKVFMSVPNF
jgi:hypothetical protein